MPAKTPPLLSWNASKQQQYREQHPAQAITLHVVLDASPSMLIHGRGELLKQAYAMYLAWLQHQADPMCQVAVSIFSTAIVHHPLVALGACKPLTPEQYEPRNGNGTALYRAVGEVCTKAKEGGQHLLIVFTDGLDTNSEELGWTASAVQQLLATLQEQAGWVGVFLGAMPEALEVGQAMGFSKANCLTFPGDKIPDAFSRLTKATERYLLATPVERKLLAEKGVF